MLPSRQSWHLYKTYFGRSDFQRAAEQRVVAKQAHHSVRDLLRLEYPLGQTYLMPAALLHLGRLSDQGRIHYPRADAVDTTFKCCAQGASEYVRLTTPALAAA